jgi:asparagine synthase (glutamine-hydrolysing)
MLPREIVRRQKKGFGVPLARWFRTDLAPLLEESFSADSLRRGGFFRHDAVGRLVAEHMAGRADHRKKLYTLLAFSLWARRHRVA